MAISVGEKLPEVTFIVPGEDGPAKVTTSEFFGGKKVVLFGLPGAFTGTCSTSHVPGYAENYDAITGKGIDEIAVTSVNDFSVMRAWQKSTGADRIVHLADGNAEFAKAIGMDVDLSVGGMGLRSARYSMIVEDGVVKVINGPDKPGEAIEAGAAKMLEQL